ncbi:thioesterase [Psychroflexus salis]|uniref:Thioesterase n=2 Tax=Psychroflexus salis TaxID=1526574 RepID=A0A917ECV8_9FLAO|nr:thioesterase [Psychroflexus salis]
MELYIERMKLTPKKINWFLLLKLPSAWFCGVRLNYINHTKSLASVRFKWINQNPFKSMYFAVQAMAAELTTGALVMQSIQNENKNISMLVAENKAEFVKKATGKIQFECTDGKALNDAMQLCINQKEGATFWMKSEGKNEANEVVSIFYFKWTLKVKS